MNQDPNTHSSMNTAFGGGQTNATQTNPFTGDLKGEFTSDFGTNTNAVSQIFKNNGFGGENKNRTIIMIAVLLLVVGAAAYLMFDTGSTEEHPVDDLAAEDKAATEDAAASEDKDTAAEDATAADTKAAEAAPAEEAAAAPATTAAPMASADAGSTGAIQLNSPGNGAGVAYDETQGPAVFSWQGPADRINFSRHSSMQPLARSVKLKGATSYSFNHPHPGTWYWQVQNASGASEVRSFTVQAPVRRNVTVSEPASGGSLSGNGGVVAWQGDQMVARYQVQFVQAGSSWANPNFRFGTAGDRVAIQGVAAGQYDMRVGAFSEVSGRWEWTEVKGVTVQ